MNKQILDYVKLLTKKDKKSLIGKALKTSEEVGELSKTILPFSNAEGTLHRFVTKKDVLEEVTDVILSALSIAYDLGYDDSDIEEMMYEKSLYWNELQIKEENVKSDEIPFEIHITVKTSDLNKFKETCTRLNVKPIILELQLENDNILQDVMTSSNYIGSNTGAYNETKRISEGLKNIGFDVVREKIETVPWHPSAPSNKDSNSDMPKNCYFETHFNIICNDKRKDFLKIIAEKWDCHLSRNVFKKIDDENYNIMVTYRSYNAVYEEFKNKVDFIKKIFIEYNYDVDKVILEFAIYDTKISHDFNWLAINNEKTAKTQ